MFWEESVVTSSRKMAYVAGRRFLQPIKASLNAIISPYYSSSFHAACPSYGRCGPLKTLLKDLEPVFHKNATRFEHNLNMQRMCLKNFSFAGSKLSVGSIFGVSVVFGSITCWPHFAHAMDGLDTLVDDYIVDSFQESDLEESPHTFRMLAEKLLLPVLFFITVLLNWDHPIKLVIKAILFLLSTNPRPSLVYLSVQQLCRQCMRQEPYFYKLKSLYASKVEVKDYMLLCLAKVEIGDKKFNLVGILGHWWILPSLPLKVQSHLLGRKL